MVTVVPGAGVAANERTVRYSARKKNAIERNRFGGTDRARITRNVRPVALRSWYHWRRAGRCLPGETDCGPAAVTDTWQRAVRGAWDPGRRRRGCDARAFAWREPNASVTSTTEVLLGGHPECLAFTRVKKQKKPYERKQNKKLKRKTVNGRFKFCSFHVIFFPKSVYRSRQRTKIRRQFWNTR